MDKEEMVIKYKDVLSYDLLCEMCNINPDEHIFFVNPRVKKFMEKEFKKADEPVFINSAEVKDSLFRVLFEMAQEYPSIISIKFQEYSQCVLPSPMGNLENINSLFDRELKKAMFQWIIDSIVSGGFAMSGIRRFLEHYNISEDDYAELSAHRAWMRYFHREYQKERRRRQMKKKLDVTK